MIRHWIAIALLAGAGLAGSGLFHQPDPTAWAVLLVCGVVLLGGCHARLPSAVEMGIAAAALAAVAYSAPWPVNAAAVVLLAGVAAQLPRMPRWARWLGGGALVGGGVLLVQQLALFAYAGLTARTHELPWPLAKGVGRIAALLDIPVGVADNTVSLFSMRKVFPLGATWELLVDPATVCFIVGGLVLLAARAWEGAPRSPVAAWLKGSAKLVLYVLLWLPVRLALQLGLFMHRSLVTDFDEPLRLTMQLFSNGLALILLAGPALMAWRWVTMAQGPAPRVAGAPAGRRSAAGALAVLGAAAVTVGFFWEPIGQRQGGRLLVDEYHGVQRGDRIVTWEPTDRPYDTSWYGHDAGYNYACVYDYCSKFYKTARNTAPITDAALKDVDVLMVKVPTGRFAAAEVDAIVRFVNRGGGVLLVGEHTNVFGTGDYINDVARPFGFAFRYDCLFGIDSPFEQLYTLPAVPHPITQHMPYLDFAVSCSIDPGGSRGRAAILGTALRSVPADYHVNNFYPQVEDRAEARYGAFVQVWSTRHGKGRVAAFSDSTQWSNFCAFEPGKSELLIGLVEWLNHRSGVPDPRLWLLPLGLALLGGSVALARGWAGAWLPMVAVALLAWSLSCTAVRAAHQKQMPFPAEQRPLVRVVMDQTATDILLPKGGFTAGKPEGFGLFERWILRLGYFTTRRSGLDAIGEDLVVCIHPSKAVGNDYRRKMIEYVKSGGHVLVMDSAENAKSTANTILRPFGLSIIHGQPLQGSLVSEGMPTISVTGACEVQFSNTGDAALGPNRILSRMDARPAAISVRYGKGSVTAVGFGSRFSDANMGIMGDLVPDPTMREVYEVEFRLLRQIIEGPATTRPASTQPLVVEGDAP